MLTDGLRLNVPAIVVLPNIRSAARRDPSASRRDPSMRLEEACGLAAAIDLAIVHSEVIELSKPHAATLLGKGKIEQLAAHVKELEAELVIVDHPLTPVQQRNLERDLNAKVLDRTGLILEIFGRRAQTKEGVLQVELAHLSYQKGRLVRSWTHLERQRGGAGFLGGPGETQIETDRRLIQDKIERLKSDLEKVRQTRALHRQQRESVPHPVIALVGYTNAGKSTLFNRLTGADVMAKDLLFATLDPTLRRLVLPHGTRAILSDTVGFISELPTHLVAAFRATLEEVRQASLIVHVRDVASPDSAQQADDVHAILKSLDIEPDGSSVPMIEVWNKIDLLDQDDGTVDRLSLKKRTDGVPTVAVSATTGEGLDTLLGMLETRLSGGVKRVTVRLDPQSLSAQSLIYERSRVVARRNLDDGGLELDTEVMEPVLERFRATAGVAVVEVAPLS